MLGPEQRLALGEARAAFLGLVLRGVGRCVMARVAGIDLGKPDPAPGLHHEFVAEAHGGDCKETARE